MPRRRDPAIPVDLDAEAVRVFERARLQLEEQGTWKAADVDLLGAYARALQTARQARARIAGRLKGEGEHAAYFSLGSTRQLVSHPDVQLARQAEGDAERYAAALLLSPQARTRARLATDAGIDAELAAMLGGGG